MTSSLLQDAVVTIVAGVSALSLVRRVIGLIAPGQGPACDACGTTKARTAPSTAAAPTPQHMTLWKRSDDSATGVTPVDG
jgi:hypothetical protein